MVACIFLGQGGQLRAQENQWVSLEDTNDVETPFWFVKGEDINYAAQTIFGNRFADKKGHGLQDEAVLDSSKTTLCLDPLIFSEWLSSKSGKNKFAEEAVVAIQEECETEILKIFELANIRSRNEANVARLNSFIAKSCQPINWLQMRMEAAGVNLDETIEGGDISLLTSHRHSGKKLVKHRCNELHANPPFHPVVRLEHIWEAKFIVKSVSKLMHCNTTTKSTSSCPR